nr:hypothetical protein [Tanacetum cinerariifolium]
MTDVTAPTGQAPSMASPVHSNDQSLPHIRWVQTGFCSLWHRMYDTVMQDLGIPRQGQLLHSSAPASDHSKSKRTIESRAKRSSKIISLGHDSTLLASSHTVKSKTDVKSPMHYPRVGFNSLVHSLRALSTLRRFGLRTASTAAKPCQGDSSELYLITCRIPTVAAAGQKGRQFTTPCPLFKLIIDDSKKTYNTASTTLMYAVMIQDRPRWDNDPEKLWCCSGFSE